MPRISTYTVVPKLPERLKRLRDIANNLWWCWEPEAIELFLRIERDLWSKVNQNPTQLLGLVSQDRLAALATEDSFLAHLDRVAARLDSYMQSGSWRERNPSAPEGFNVAYFSAEFALHESVPIYSGGLGVLAGDHLKSASDLGLPAVGVSLLYREGYFQQYLNADGWQQERYPRNDFYNMPLTLMLDAQGKQLTVEVAYPEGPAKARVWRCQVGRVPLYLLDCDYPENDPDDREITGRLYAADRNMRIRQEIMLGMGGVKALHAMGIYPTVYHMNEGHSAFMTLQRIKDLIETERLTVDQALEAVKAGSVFTTHTPVAAGNEMFPPDMIDRYFRTFTQEIGMPMEQLLSLGRQDPHDHREPFCMTVLALRLSTMANGVSALHGQTARSMWQRTWADIPEPEVPITSIVNGIHTRFWTSRDMAGLYDRYLGPGWVANPADPVVWARIDQVPDAELWRTHERRRERLVTYARRRLVAQLEARGAPSVEIRAAGEALDPEVLTIAFARRFATYKRANMILMDPERLVRILTNDKRLVQFIIAGKAHPADNQGKELIRNIIHFVRKYNVRNHVVFLEDYDLNLARYMVQGVDCWLNTPRRPLEASGTSGMKAAVNGVLHISIPDGWWCEAQGLGENGWTIGRGESYPNPDEQDVVESDTLYSLLEREVVPMFYERGRDGLPRRWIERMKTAIKTICPMFNTHRMVQEYTDRFYIPCTLRRNALRADGRSRSKALAEWKQKIRRRWGNIRVVSVESGPTEALPYGSRLDVRADVYLDELTDQDVTVEVYYGGLDPLGRIADGRYIRMDFAERLDGKVYRFTGAIHCDKTGQQGFTVRVIPSHPDLAHKHETCLISWA